MAPGAAPPTISALALIYSSISSHPAYRIAEGQDFPGLALRCSGVAA